MQLTERKELTEGQANVLDNVPEWAGLAAIGAAAGFASTFPGGLITGGIVGGAAAGGWTYLRTGDSDEGWAAFWGGLVGGFIGGGVGRFVVAPWFGAAGDDAVLHGVGGLIVGTPLGAKIAQALVANAPVVPASPDFSGADSSEQSPPPFTLPEMWQEFRRRIGADGSVATTTVGQQWREQAADMRKVSRDLTNTDVVNAGSLDPALIAS